MNTPRFSIALFNPTSRVGKPALRCCGLLAAACLVLPLHAQDTEKEPPAKTGAAAAQDADGVDGLNVDAALQAEYRRLLRKYGMTIVDKSKINGAIPIKLGDISEERLLTFFSSLDMLPISFIRKSGIRKVLFCSSINYNGSAAAGLASGDTIYLASDNGWVIYHELFHIADPQRKNSRWTLLNNRNFIYGGSQFRDAKLTASQRKKMENDTADYSADFASDYAMTFEWEDRAETFTLMLMSPKAFAKKAEASPVLAKKGALIREISKRFSSDMDADYWDFVAQSDDKSRQQTLVERAQANASGKQVTTGGYKREQGKKKEE